MSWTLTTLETVTAEFSALAILIDWSITSAVSLTGTVSVMELSISVVISVWSIKGFSMKDSSTYAIELGWTRASSLATTSLVTVSVKSLEILAAAFSISSCTSIWTFCVFKVVSSFLE